MTANYFMLQSGADIFTLFYIKRRIEQDGHLEWYEAPYCAEEDPPREWLLIEEAALLFEQENRQEMEECMIRRLEPIGKLNFRSFKTIVRHYMDLISKRLDKSVSLLALIAFTGMYARRLAELDKQQADLECNKDLINFGASDYRDFRREIYQVSIYGSHILLATLDGSWESFCADIAKLVEEIRAEQSHSPSPQKPLHQRPTVVLGAAFPQLCGIGIPLMALCGVGAATFLLIRKNLLG